MDRLQVLVHPHDRAGAEGIVRHWYGISLNQFLRMVIKLIAQEKLDLTVVYKDPLIK
jgi:hypothetical protein